ncbi:MAG: hypothetical protein K2M20_11135 [Lachnospiraceae bacterium]|nr:hypothetical protein [Lachnospiraceae bacterium]
MDENTNYGYNGGNYNNQGADGGQQYGQNEQPFVSAPQNGQPYANQQQYGQSAYGQAPQYNQVPYGAQQQYNQQNFGQPVKAVVYDAVPDKTHGTSVASLVCGILGLILFWFPGVDIGLCLGGLICGIVSLVKGLGGKGLAITGLILSVLASILTLIFFYFFALGMMLM